MKTQIVQLEPHDDYLSVRDRMGWGQTTRVLLVWPRRKKILNRRLDLTLIKRHSITLGSQLALVTRDREVRYQADILNIPVYKSVRQAEQSRWRRPHKHRISRKISPTTVPYPGKQEKPDLAVLREQAHPKPSRWITHPAMRISIFTIGVLSMLVIVSIFIPSAEILITPASKSETVSIDVIANSDRKTVDLSGAIPTYLKSVVVEGRGRTPATGETLIPRQTAVGRVIFLNLTDKEINVPTGIIVSTQDDPPIRFATTQEVIIPTGSEGSTVSIQAIQPGTFGNVPPEKIVAIEGPLGLNLSVTNRRRTDGGSDFTAVTPTEDDYQKVYDQLFESLQETARDEFEIYTAPGDVSLSSIPVNHQVLEESYFPEAGKPADYLEMNLRTEFQFPYASETDLYQLGLMVLNRHIIKDFTSRPETLQITQLTQPAIQESGNSSWKIQASWQMDANLNETEAISLIIGLEPEQALHQLNEHTTIEPGAEIQLTPSWWPRLPMLPFRIKLINLLETPPVDN